MQANHPVMAYWSSQNAQGGFKLALATEQMLVGSKTLFTCYVFPFDLICSF